MHQFIFDLISARGWSMRHLSELTDLSYSGIRDYLKGFPQRLSAERLQRVYDVLDLNELGQLKENTLYTWRVEAKDDCLTALNRVLQRTIELNPNAKMQKFEAKPLISGDLPGLPAPFWVLRLHDIYIIINWSFPKNPRIKKVSYFHTSSNKLPHPTIVNPDIFLLNCLEWAPDTELSETVLRGIYLSPNQLKVLNNADTLNPIELPMLKEWLQKPAEDDPFFGLELTEKKQWTWGLITHTLKNKFNTPEAAAAALKL